MCKMTKQLEKTRKEKFIYKASKKVVMFELPNNFPLKYYPSCWVCVELN